MANNDYMTQEEAQLRQQLASIIVVDHGTEYRLTPEYVQQHMYAAVINTREFDTSKLKRILQSLETGLFFCQIFVFII